MRANTREIHARPELSAITSPQGEAWGLLRFSNPSACLAAVREYGLTPNERNWSNNSNWIGLNKQSHASFLDCGVSEHSKTLVQKESRKLSDSPSRPGTFRPAITGGYWDTPSVIAGLPLAARTRVKTKLPPKTLTICMSMSAGINAEAVAKIAARIAHAVWQYTIAGGAVTIDVAFCGYVRASSYAPVSGKPVHGLIVQTRVNASDVAALATVLSPVWFRGATGRLITAFSEHNSDSIPIPHKCPLSNAFWIGGVMQEVLEAGNKVLASLRLAD